RMMRWNCLLWCAVLAMGGGCETPTADQNPQVFQTPDEIVAQRAAQRQRQWRELAAQIVREQRPDVSVGEGEGLALTVSADGVSREIDLARVEERLIAQ